MILDVDFSALKAAQADSSPGAAAKKMAVKYTEESKRLQSLKKNRPKKTDTRLLSIASKMRRGKKLSKTELGYLKKVSPGLYQKAAAADRKRDRFEKELRLCKDKEDVRRLRARVTMSVGGGGCAGGSVGGDTGSVSLSTAELSMTAALGAAVSGLDAALGSSTSSVSSAMAGVVAAQVQAALPPAPAAVSSPDPQVPAGAGAVPGQEGTPGQEAAALPGQTGSSDPNDPEGDGRRERPGRIVFYRDRVSAPLAGSGGGTGTRVRVANVAYRSLDDAYRSFKQGSKYRKMSWKKARRS